MGLEVEEQTRGYRPRGEVLEMSVREITVPPAPHTEWTPEAREEFLTLLNSRGANLSMGEAFGEDDWGDEQPCLTEETWDALLDEGIIDSEGRLTDWRSRLAMPDGSSIPMPS